MRKFYVQEYAGLLRFTIHDVHEDVSHVLQNNLVTWMQSLQFDISNSHRQKILYLTNITDIVRQLTFLDQNSYQNLFEPHATAENIIKIR